MSSKQLSTGSTLSDLEHEAFQLLSESVGTHPENILYLGQPNHSRDETRERWEEYGPSASLRLTTFEEFVSDCYERDQYKGRVTVIDRPLLFRLVEQGVEEIESPENPFYTGERFPRAGIVEEAEDLYTDLEFAGLLSAEAMHERLVEEGLTSRAEHVAELADEIASVREEILADTLRETYQTERMDHVIQMDTELDEVFPSVEAVIIGGFNRFDVLEQQLLANISETWPTIGLLPLQHESEPLSGVDAAATQAFETYRDLDFVQKHQGETDPTKTDNRRRITASLYRHPEHAPPINDIDSTSLELIYTQPQTVPDEIRDVARDLRRELALGTEADDVGVVLTSPTEYDDQVGEIFEIYEIPYTVQTDLPFTETALGEVVETICSLAREPRSVDSLLALLTNPLVTVSNGGEPLDHNELRRTAMRVESTRLATTLEHVDNTVAATVESILNDASALTDVELEELPGRLNALLDRLGVSTALTDDERFSREFLGRESNARGRLDRVLETLVLTSPVADLDQGGPVDRLERAIANVSISSRGVPDDQRVVICGLGEAFLREFEHIYILGLTASHFPSDAEPLAFTRPIYESHPDFERKDPGKVARYHFGSLLASETSIRLSTPQRSQSGDPYVEADVITELRRVLDFDEITEDGRDPPPGNQEDVQQAIGEAWTRASDSKATSLIESATDAGTFSSRQHTRMRAGVECVAARADPELTPHDGRISAETVAAVHSEPTRQPYSASRLETYASCGFKYYMRRVLGIEAPDPITREPDAMARGSYIHDVLEHYYLGLQSAKGDPVDPGGDFEARQETLLAVALDRLDEAFAEFPETAFHEQWLMSVLAGLGTSETNPFYRSKTGSRIGRDETTARGLFYRFLEHEFEEPAKTTARPTWFEARIGDPYDAGTPVGDGPAIIETPHGQVPVHGLIDRIDTVPGTDPIQLVVRDYKTGSSIPSATDALLGLNFQLPLYALMAEEAFDNVETVGAAYYQVSPPDSVNSRKGLVTSQEMAAWQGSDEVDVPLLRYSYPDFEIHEAFRRFIEEETPKRLGRLVAGIEDGRFHPTVLDPDDAGCHYCDYGHVCDVRPEHRRKTIAEINTNDIPVYVPPKALDREVEDAVEVT